MAGAAAAEDAIDDEGAEAVSWTNAGGAAVNDVSDAVAAVLTGAGGVAMHGCTQ